MVAGAIVPRPGQWRETLRNITIWIGLFLLLMAGYVYRYDLQDFGSTMTAGLIPGSPVSGQTDNGRNTVTLIRGDDSHFHAKAEINGVAINLLVDTGATQTVLSASDAEKVGIALNRLSYSVPVQTANGKTMSARARIADLRIGSIERRDFSCLVSQPGNLRSSLLGMDFVQSLWGFEIRGDRMILTN